MRLLRASADVNAADAKGQTPLHLAAKAPAGVAVIRLLLENGAEPSLHCRMVQPPYHLPLEAAQYFRRSGARNREFAEGSVNVLSCASHPLSTSILRNELVGGLVRGIVFNFIAASRRASAALPRLPPELWDRVLMAVPGLSVLEVLWRLQDRKEQLARAMAERLSSARAAAAESMDLFEQLAGDMAAGTNHSAEVDATGLGRRALSALSVSVRRSAGSTERRVSHSAEAPAALTIPTQRRGLPLLFESDEEEVDGNAFDIPEGCCIPITGSICSARPSAPCPCGRVPCVACGVGVRECSLDDHSTLCPRRAVRCPVGCGRLVEAAALTRHYQKQCSEYWVRCLGCTGGVPILRKEFDEHLDHWHTKRPAPIAGVSDPFRGVPCALRAQEVVCPLVGCGCTVRIPATTSATITRQTVQRHVATCTLWRMACPGCGREMHKRAWEEHSATCRVRLVVHDMKAMRKQLLRRSTEHSGPLSQES